METQREISLKDGCGFKLKFLANCNVCKVRRKAWGSGGVAEKAQEFRVDLILFLKEKG